MNGSKTDFQMTFSELGNSGAWPESLCHQWSPADK